MFDITNKEDNRVVEMKSHISEPFLSTKGVKASAAGTKPRLLGGPGACSPGKILKSWYSLVASGLFVFFFYYYYLRVDRTV